MVPWLNPTRPSALEGRRKRSSWALKNASRRGPACATPRVISPGSRKVRLNHCRPIGAMPQGCGAWGETKAACGSRRDHSRPKPIRSLPSAPYPCRKTTSCLEGPPEAGGSRGPSRRGEVITTKSSRTDALLGELVGGVSIELAVILDADVLEQVELGLEVIDVAFLVGEQFLEEVHGHIVLLFAATGAGLHVEGARAIFGLQVAFQHLLDVLADHQGVDVLQIGKAFEEDDADHKLVGVLHLLDRFLPLLLGEPGEA